MGYHESLTEGRNAVLEAFRSGKTVDRLFVLDGCQDGPVKTILREAKKQDTMVQYVKKERLDQLSETKNHQGVIAYCAACEYAEVSDILENAKKKGEAPFIVLLDGIEDPHNLGAIIRTANQAGAHGVIIPKSSWFNSDSCTYLCRCSELYACCKSNKSCYCNGRLKERGNVVCLCRYGRRGNVFP